MGARGGYHISASASARICICHAEFAEASRKDSSHSFRIAKKLSLILTTITQSHQHPLLYPPPLAGEEI